jgi:hypothetical protein
VTDHGFIDRSEVRGVTVTPIDGLLEPRPGGAVGVDHTAAYRIRAQRVGRDEPVTCVVTGEWKPMSVGTFCFSPSRVMQNTNRPGSAPDFVVSDNWSLRALAGQLVTEFAKPGDEVMNYHQPLPTQAPQ